MTYHPSCKGPSPARYQRLWSFGVPVAAAGLLLLGSTTAAKAQDNLVVLPVTDCNSQALLDGSELVWTSSFSIDNYQFNETNRLSRIIIEGEGQIAQVSVQWCIVGGTADDTTEGAVDFRGARFSPSGVRATLYHSAEAAGVERDDPPEPDRCFNIQECTLDGVSTFFLEFTQLHFPFRRGSEIAKGTAHLRVDAVVEFDEFSDVVGLGTNVHVATPGVEEDEDD